MLPRVLSAAIGIPLFLGICLWGPTPFAVGATVLAAIGLAEFTRAYTALGNRPNPLFGAAGLLGPAWLLLRPSAPSPAHALMLALALGLAGLVWEVVRAARTGELHAARDTGYGLLAGMYVALFGGMVWLRAWPGPLGPTPYPWLEPAAALLLVTVFCVWATDSFAYFTGRALGRHKLAPRLSPNKTVEGSAGGLVASLVVGAALGAWWLGSIPMGLQIGVVAGIFGQVGDLYKSCLKREAGIKDFGALMPGHGGVLDRFDSLMLVAPLVGILLSLWPVSGR